MKKQTNSLTNLLDSTLSDGYKLVKEIGSGKIGTVFKATRTSLPNDTAAIKVIASTNLRKGWEEEIRKVSLLRDVPGVVQYYDHGTDQKDDIVFVWVRSNYVSGNNLKELLVNDRLPLDIAFVEVILKSILSVLYACKKVGIRHGDLHSGNILISNPDERIPGSPKRVYVSDFGYGGSHNNLDPKDDFRQLGSIGKLLLGRILPDSLTPADRLCHLYLNSFIDKYLLETDPTQGSFVRNADELLNELTDIRVRAEREAATASSGETVSGFGDYPWAEALGFRENVWKELFVPRFLGADSLLSRSITILTGARGCGKTMVFRRLTEFMDLVLGEPSEVPRASEFVGFYLNCRVFVEAFPWLKPSLTASAEAQIKHYFHLLWLAEVVRTLSLRGYGGESRDHWISNFLHRFFEKKYMYQPDGTNVLAHASAFLESEKEECRLTDIGSLPTRKWPLARLDFLDLLHESLARHEPWIGERPLYFFLDDYTIPTITEQVQRVLNPIIFKRRSSIFFKVATESANSLLFESADSKPLQLNQDYDLVDLATESLYLKRKEKRKMLEELFHPRINRHPGYRGNNLGLVDILGETRSSNNEMALHMREGKRVMYQGVDCFVGMWTSDIRGMIRMLAGMLESRVSATIGQEFAIDDSVQDLAYRDCGRAEYKHVDAVIDPSTFSRRRERTHVTDHGYGSHIRDIIEAFIRVTRFEMTEGQLVRNEERLVPKQAFRLEVVDEFDLTTNAMSYLSGLVRWHVFLQDWRGKSVRGMITPRLYLNRMMIPFFNLTFSSREHIQLTNSELERLLCDPNSFFDFWTKKRRSKTAHRDQQSFFGDSLDE